jgi:hypothetical protein
VLVVFLSSATMVIPVVGGGAGTPAIIIFFAILLAAWYGGLGPGLLATASTSWGPSPPTVSTRRGASCGWPCSWGAG